MAKKQIILDPPFLDDEEKELIEAIDYSNSDSSSDFEKQKMMLEQAAHNTMNPPKTQISVRLSKYDLPKLKAIAMKKGIPYQTLLGSIVHQYVEGQLKEI